METQEFAEHFPLFHNLNNETIEWLLSLVEEENYEVEETIIAQDDWGSGFHLIESGWVKVQHFYAGQPVTIEIIGEGGFVGEVGILGQNNFNSQVVAISAVKVLTISAQRFIQVLFRDAQVQNRLLKLMVNRVTDYQKSFRFHHQATKVRLVTVLISLADQYGKVTENGIEIYDFAVKDLADLALISIEECEQILEKLKNKNLIKFYHNHKCLMLTNIKQLHHIIGQLGNE